MRFSIALFSTATVVLANNVDVATVLLNDIGEHINDYMSLVGGTIPIPTDLVKYYTEVATYTDDSYTSILSDFPTQQVESIVTQLPWYSSRLESKLSVAFTENNAKITTSSPTESSSVTPNLSVAITTSSPSVILDSSSSEASSSISTTVVSPSTETSSKSSIQDIVTYTGGANNLNGLLPVVLASPLLSFLI